jgi:hypothetical protein
MSTASINTLLTTRFNTEVSPCPLSFKLIFITYFCNRYHCWWWCSKLISPTSP